MKFNHTPDHNLSGNLSSTNVNPSSISDPSRQIFCFKFFKKKAVFVSRNYLIFRKPHSIKLFANHIPILLWRSVRLRILIFRRYFNRIFWSKLIEKCYQIHQNERIFQEMFHSNYYWTDLIVSFWTRSKKIHGLTERKWRNIGTVFYDDWYGIYIFHFLICKRRLWSSQKLINF